MERRIPRSSLRQIGCALLLLGVVIPSLRHARASANSSPPEDLARLPVTFDLRHLQLIAVRPDRVELSAECEATSTIAANLRKITFSATHIDHTIPIFVDGLEAPIALRKGQITTLPPLKVTLYFADLPSFQPLQNILSAHSLRIESEIRAELSLSFLDRLALHAPHPTAIGDIDQQVSFSIGAADAPIALGVGLLNLGQRTVEGIESLARSAFGDLLPTISAEDPDELRSLLLLHTRYRIQADGNAATFTCDRLGFWISPHLAVVPAEALQPWAFSVEQAAWIGEHGGKVEAVEISVQPLAALPDATTPDAFWSLQRGDFRILRQGKATEERILLPGKAGQATLRNRDSPGNFAILRFREGIAGSAFVILEARNPGARNPRTTEFSAPARQLHLFRRSATTPTHVQVLPANRPVDETAFGSPIVSSTGAVALVQSETKSLALSSILTPNEEANDPPEQHMP